MSIMWINTNRSNPVGVPDALKVLPRSPATFLYLPEFKLLAVHAENSYGESDGVP